MVLYRKYRPQTLSEVVGQDQIRESLLAQLTSGKIAHAYLFSGPRGTGKTSVARILAKAVNCLSHGANRKSTGKESDKPFATGDLQFGEPCGECEACKAITSGTHLDLIEIDAASNRGIDEIRDLREKIKLSPAQGRFKVYIVDEAHMLTTEAFNALLKTLEEPPEHAIFILATTERQRIPATIASRTTRFDFKIPSTEQIREKLSLIVKKEKWKLSDDVLEEVARSAGGAFRDAEVLLEKISSVDSNASLEKTRQILGKSEVTTVTNLLNVIEEGQTKGALIWLDDYINEGGSVRVLTENILEVLRKALLFKAGAQSVIEVSVEEEKALGDLANKIAKERLLELVSLFNKALSDLRDSPIVQLPLEIAIIEASTAHADEIIAVKENPDIEVENIKAKDFEEAKAAPSVEKYSGSEKKILKKLQEHWPKFLKALKPLNSSLEMFLRNAKAIEIDEDLVTIEFPYRFHKEKVEERKYRELIESVLEQITGAKLQIKGVIGERAPVKKEETVREILAEKNIDPVEVFGKLD